MNPVPGTCLTKETFWDRNPGLPGAFAIAGGRILCECPCGCGRIMNLPVHLADAAPTDHPSWTWDGNVERPTLQPSIRDLAHCRFHGYLTDGVWTFEADSGVK